jgi:hypothetical protein
MPVCFICIALEEAKAPKALTPKRSAAKTDPHLQIENHALVEFALNSILPREEVLSYLIVTSGYQCHRV